jgi:integrase/recombinase XerD
LFINYIYRMQTINLLPQQHRNKQCLLLQFENDHTLNNIVRKLPNAKWSQTHKSWYLPLSEANYRVLAATLKSSVILNVDALRSYLYKCKAVVATLPPLNARKLLPGVIVNNGTEQPLPNNKKVVLHAPQPLAAFSLSDENLAALGKMVNHLKLKAYSPSTIRTYRNELQVFLLVLGKHPAEKLTTEDVKRYLLKCINDGLSENTMHSRINALKYYYEQVLLFEKFFVEIPRPKKPFLLPAFFNQDEITAIINATQNIKHKAMLMLAYSSGMRVSEVVAMETKNIDSKRMCILIKRAKGKKDRMAALSPVLLIMLREYWNVYQPKKDGYLFAGQVTGQPYSTRSLQLILEAAKNKAGILKPGSVHALRHSFATHLLDKGTDVTMIMKLLGHNDIKTTLRYLHVTNRDMLQIISPLDDLRLD